MITNTKYSRARAIKITIPIHFLCVFLWMFSSIVSAQTNPIDDFLGTLKKTYEEQSKPKSNKCQNQPKNPFFIAKKIETNSLDSMVPLTDEEEMEIGQKIFEKISEDKQINNDHPMYSQINQIFQKLIRHVKREEIKYKLHIVESETINAFSTLGGNVYVHTGLIDFVESWDEMAFILGHEIAHIDEYHTVRRIKKIMLIDSFGKSVGIKDFSKVALNINQTLSASFDQIDEYNADEMGYEIAKIAGYDITKFADFFTKLEKSEKKNILRKFLSTHPFPSERKKCLETIEKK